MNGSPIDWLEIHGYLAVLVATLLQGAAVLMLAGFLAHQGHLDLGAVLLVALVGGSTGNQLLFWFGRIWGPALQAQSAILERAGQRVGTVLRRHDAGLIVGIRFMYGVRIAGPIAMGALGVLPRRFAVFNLLGRRPGRRWSGVSATCRAMCSRPGSATSSGWRACWRGWP
ncbi:MAG TPA: DedA family protein [Ramlibacter sp.]